MTNTDRIRNTMERRAHLIVEAMEAQAERMDAAMNEPPAGQVGVDAQRVREMWTFSPFPQPEQAFWAMHDLLLSQGAPPDMAEMRALEAVYPQRLVLAKVGATTIARQIALAERAARLVERDPDVEAMA